MQKPFEGWSIEHYKADRGKIVGRRDATPGDATDQDDDGAPEDKPSTDQAA